MNILDTIKVIVGTLVGAWLIDAICIGIDWTWASLQK